jgi:alkylhydroperoxidase family enzyme
MPRLKEISRAEAPEQVTRLYDLVFGAGRDPVAEPGTETGTPGNWWTVFANSPEALAHAVAGFAFYRSSARQLAPALRELGQMRAGWARGSQFVFSQHCKAGRSAGLSDAQVEAVPAWQTADCFSPLERAVLAYSDALVLDGGRVADGTFAALRAGGLSDAEILELTYIVCLYEMHATMCRALRLEFDDVDERVVEILGPDGAKTLDAMRRVDRPG